MAEKRTLAQIGVGLPYNRECLPSLASREYRAISMTCQNWHEGCNAWGVPFEGAGLVVHPRFMSGAYTRPHHNPGYRVLCTC